jgi:dTDP-4-dehydrorhamnose 3,5-epimerase
MNYIKANIEGPVIIEPKVFGDERGYFFESFESFLRVFQEISRSSVLFAIST